MMYRPVFTKDEFHHPTGHYEINLGGRRILYAYMRKNACTAFKRLISHEYERKNPSIGTKELQHRNRFHLSGNMKHFLVRRNALESMDVFDNIIFVYRDPLDRLISVFTNKFIANSSAKDIKRSFENLTELRFEEATFEDFMNYTKIDFARLDRHVWPQKAHLWDIEYTNAIRMEELQQSMRELIGAGPSERWFGRRVNSSTYGDTSSSETLTSVSVSELRSYMNAGNTITKNNFITDNVKDFVSERYKQDFEMISEIEAMSERQANGRGEIARG